MAEINHLIGIKGSLDAVYGAIGTVEGLKECGPPTQADHQRSARRYTSASARSAHTLVQNEVLRQRLRKHKAGRAGDVIISQIGVFHQRHPCGTEGQRVVGFFVGFCPTFVGVSPTSTFWSRSCFGSKGEGLC